MAKRRSFKSDEEFLTYISMGAFGVRQVMEDLRHQGHSPILLERGSNDFKLWRQIRIKGMRVPDILCVNNARRVESRAKTDFEISGSHSPLNPERAWDFGLSDLDYLAIPVCEKSGQRPIDWQVSNLVQYASVRELRKSRELGLTETSDPKAANQVSEVRVIWPSTVATSAGTVVAVEEDRIQYKVGNRTNTIRLTKRGKRLIPLVASATQVERNQVLAAVLPVTRQVPIEPVIDFSHYLKDLDSMSTSARFAAAKALGLFQEGTIPPALIRHLEDVAEHIFVRLETAASLTRHRFSEGWTFLQATIRDEFTAHRLEAVIVLAEIDDPQAREMLLRVLADENEIPDIRAGAAWALGEHKDAGALDALVRAFSSHASDIRIEAARALAKIAPQHVAEVLRLFHQTTADNRPGVAWAIGKIGGVRFQDILPLHSEVDVRQWAAYILGIQGREKYIAEIEQLRQQDPEVYFAATVLWKILTNWAFELKDYG